MTYQKFYNIKNLNFQTYLMYDVKKFRTKDGAAITGKEIKINYDFKLLPNALLIAR